LDADFHGWSGFVCHMPAPFSSFPFSSSGARAERWPWSSAW
jgi:hypothetical protein